MQLQLAFAFFGLLGAAFAAPLPAGIRLLVSSNRLVR